VAKKPVSTIDNVVSLAKRRGFVFPSGEIYGGTRSAWDYGPLGVELKENIKRQWWRAMVTAREDIVGIDSSVILPTRTWEASGHLSTFTDPLTECQSCHKRFREDHLQEEYAVRKGIEDPDTVDINEQVPCPNCGTRGAWTESRAFNMMLKTYLGPVEDESGLYYLRPETAQGIFLNFANVMSTSRVNSSACARNWSMLPRAMSRLACWFRESSEATWVASVSSSSDFGFQTKL
jgi:glycyl-tRNA synthetase